MMTKQRTPVSDDLLCPLETTDEVLVEVAREGLAERLPSYAALAPFDQDRIAHELVTELMETHRAQ